MSFRHLQIGKVFCQLNSKIDAVSKLKLYTLRSRFVAVTKCLFGRCALFFRVVGDP